jgi:hypothetical protein
MSRSSFDADVSVTTAERAGLIHGNLQLMHSGHEHAAHIHVHVHEARVLGARRRAKETEPKCQNCRDPASPHHWRVPSRRQLRAFYGTVKTLPSGQIIASR